MKVTEAPTHTFRKNISSPSTEEVKGSSKLKSFHKNLPSTAASVPAIQA
jgi:hypothetical protein